MLFQQGLHLRTSFSQVPTEQEHTDQLRLSFQDVGIISAQSLFQQSGHLGQEPLGFFQTPQLNQGQSERTLAKQGLRRFGSESKLSDLQSLALQRLRLFQGANPSQKFGIAI